MTKKARPTVTDALRAIDKKLDRLDTKIDALPDTGLAASVARLDTKIDALPDTGLAASVASLAASFATLDTKVASLDTKVDELQTGLINLAVETRERFTSIDQRFVAFDKRFDKVDAQMKVFGKKLDETRVDIIGHVDRVYDEVVGRLGDLERPKHPTA